MSTPGPLTEKVIEYQDVMKQLVPTGLDEYLVEHKEGDVVTGRVVEVSGETAKVELGEGIRAQCRIGTAAKEASPSTGKADLSSLTSMLQTRWKSGPSAQVANADAVQTGQVRKFRIARVG